MMMMMMTIIIIMDWDILVGIATRYGLEGPGIETRWGQDFPPDQTDPGAHPDSHAMGTGSLSRGKAAGAWR